MHAEIRKYCNHIKKTQFEVLKQDKEKGVWYWDLPSCVSFCHNGNYTRMSRGYSHLPDGTKWHDTLRRLILQLLGPMGEHSHENTRNIIGNCSEQHAGNNYMRKYAEMNVANLHFSEAIRPRTMEVIQPCANCKKIFPTLNP